MWETYEPPGEKQAKPSSPAAPAAPSAPDAGLGPSRPGRRGPITTGPRRNGAGVVGGVVAVLASIGIAMAIAGSVDHADPEPDYSGFHECVAAYEADGEPDGLLSPADLCDIGNEVPPDYVDTYEYEPENGFGY